MFYMQRTSASILSYSSLKTSYTLKSLTVCNTIIRLTKDVTTLPPELSLLSEVAEKLLVGKAKAPYKPNKYQKRFINKTINKSIFITGVHWLLVCKCTHRTP
jgi:hypothetical protein